MTDQRANQTQFGTLGHLVKGPQWSAGEQLRIAFENLTQTLAASVFCAFVIVAMQWPVADQRMLILWLGSISGLTLLRLMMQQKYQRCDPAQLPLKRWERGYAGATFLAGCLWGSLALVAYPAESVLHQAYLALVLGGICACAVTAYAPVVTAFPLFVVPTLTPFAARLALGDDTHGLTMALLVVLFMLALMRTAHDSRKNVVRLLDLQVKNADMTRELHHRATHDSLVDLVNQGEFTRRLTRLTSDNRRADADYSLIFVDLDLFKEVNDTGGHAAGDLILKGVGDIIRRNTRGGDTAARVGGDEFAAILEGCPHERAVEIAENIRRDIENLRVQHEGRYYSVRASIGVAYGRVGEHTATSMLKAADAACYAAKEQGRNRVCENRASDAYAISDRFELTAELSPPIVQSSTC